MRRSIALLLVAFALTGALVIGVLAHSGDTDANGGHYNRSTGEYHYHHGYSAHSHYDMDGDGDIDCPYEQETEKPKETTAVKETLPSASAKRESIVEILLEAGFFWLMGLSVASLLIIIICMVFEKSTKREVSGETEEKLQRIPKYVAFVCALVSLIIKLLKK